MKKSVLLGAGILATALLAGCGGSGGGAGVSGFSTSDLTPLAGSDTIIGTWVGATDYVETGTYGASRETYTGSRLVIFQIKSDGTGDYSLKDCNNNTAAVTLDVQTGAVSTLERNFVMTDFNRMTGTSDKAEWGSEGQEDWAWVKVSNNTDVIGSVDFSYISNSLGRLDDSADILSLCRESFAYSDTSGITWTTVADKGAYSYQNVSGDFDVRVDSDGFKEADFTGALSISASSESSDSVDLSAVNGSALNYEVGYKVANGQGDSLGATVKVSITQ